MVGMADQVFSLELNDDQRELQKWLHEFSENVIRYIREIEARNC